MKGYGETVRDIRISKGLKLKDVYLNILSKSYSIDFEKGNHEISLRLIEEILARLLLTLDEFLYIHHDYQLPPDEEFRLQYAEAGNQNDLTKLADLLKETADDTTMSARLKTAQVRSRLRQLIDFNEHHTYRKDAILQEDVSLITDYLYSLDSWTLQELLLFANSLDFIDYQEKVDLFRSLLPSLDKYKHYDRGRLAVCGLLTNVIHELLMDGELAFSKTLLDDLTLLSNSFTDIFFKIVHRYYTGIHLMLASQQELGQQQAQRAVDLLLELDQPHFSQLFQTILEEFSTKLN